MKYLGIVFLLVLPISAQSEVRKIDPAAARELIRQWVQTERILSEEKTAWKVEKQRMQDLLDLYQKELKLLSEEIEQAGASAEPVHENKEKYETELKQYEEAQQILVKAIAMLLPRVRDLILYFPAPLLQEISIDIDFLKSPNALEKPQKTLTSIITLLTESAKFNRNITVTEETRSVSGGKKINVHVLYLGLCRAYYTSATGSTAGIGIPAKDGWQWQPKPSLANKIRRAIAIHHKEKQPQLIQLPIQLTNPNKK